MLYQLMYKDEVVLEFDSATPNIHAVVNAAFLPIGIQNGMTLESWLQQRRADTSRVSIRKIITTLKINFGRDKYISQYRRPTDFWWIKNKDSDDTFDMPIEDLHLLSLNLSPIVPTNPRNFEVSNIGSYEKGWRNNLLYKHGKVDEIFSEILYAFISKKYIETADYHPGDLIKDGTVLKQFTMTPNFVDLAKGEYLVLADEWTKTAANEYFDDWFERFKGTLSVEEVEQFKIMHFLDVLLNNGDRHCQNFGFVYNENGERRVAPNFDFNLSIIGHNGLELLGRNEMPVAWYFDLFDDVPNVMKNPPIVEELDVYIAHICDLLELEFKNYQPVADWIINRWEQLL